jgi:hypothetical protein
MYLTDLMYRMEITALQQVINYYSLRNDVSMTRYWERRKGSLISRKIKFSPEYSLHGKLQQTCENIFIFCVLNHYEKL